MHLSVRICMRGYLHHVWFRAPAFENILKKLNYFYVYFLIFSYYFDMLMSKKKFKNKKNIILIYFQVKNILKNNYYLISKQLPREIEKEPNPVLLFFFTRVMKFFLQVLKMLSCEDLDSSISLPPHNFLHQFYRVTIWIPTLESIDRKMLKKITCKVHESHLLK
jgi:hypothetical protein